MRGEKNSGYLQLAAGMKRGGSAIAQFGGSTPKNTGEGGRTGHGAGH